MLDSGYIGGIAGEHPGFHGDPIPGYSKTNHYLRAVTLPILAVTPSLEIILFIYLEVDAGSVIEDQICIKVQKITYTPVNRFLDLILVTIKEIQSPVEVMKLHFPALGEVNILSKPLLIAADVTNDRRK
ncbi:MAG: hypothetical protein AVO35_12425 [Candidatus Aegiribacteria sp. MLS_C]|nr:MAG: hypothetical protein AVO35_12425 [Candidatus Aegiribacteria sp. MLS_C]